MPDERYFSMPSAEVGGDVRRNRALNCWPWVRSLTHSPWLRHGNSHDVTMPARPGAQHAETILGVVIHDPLDEARQHFLGRRFRLRTHADYPGPRPGPSNAHRFRILCGKRLFSKLSEPPRVKN